MNFELAKGLRKMPDDVACQHALFPESLGGKVASGGVEPYAQETGVAWSVALCEESRDETCQHIAAASGGHARVTHREAIDLSVGRADVGGMSL